MMFATQTVTGSCYAARLLLCRITSQVTACSFCSQRETSLRKKRYLIVFFLLSQFGEPNEALTNVGAFLFLFDVDLGFEHYSDISLTDHCLLRKLTVNLPLVAILLLITLTPLIACVISSHGNIPHTRNARVTGSCYAPVCFCVA
jgi:hypothetical protein